jgi:hypothetical protein
MDFNEHLEKDLNSYIQKEKEARYNNDTRKINFLLSINVSLMTIGKFLEKSHASIYNYKNSKNKMTKQCQESIDKLVAYTLNILSIKMEKPDYDLSDNEKKRIKNAIEEGKKILKTKKIAATIQPQVFIQGGH